MERTLHILNAEQAAAVGDEQVLKLANDADPRSISLHGVDRIELDFPKFTDGRAYSQAFLIRRRLGYQGDIRATGEVLIDQLVQMQRSGFSSAVLKDGKDATEAQRQFDRYARYYQGDAQTVKPLFREAL